MPPICPRIQLFGSCFGQEASTAKVGTSPAEAAWGRALNEMAAMQRERALAKRVSARARFDVGVIMPPMIFDCDLQSLGSAVNREEARESNLRCHSGAVRKHRTRNLEILRCAIAHHSSRFASPGMTAQICRHSGNRNSISLRRL